MENISNVQSKNYVKHYFLFWSGQQISLLGSFIAQFVIIWWITIQYRSPFFLSMASFLGFGTILLSSLIAGVYVDRYNRKFIILISDTFQAILTLIMIILFRTNTMTLTYLYLLLAFRGIFQGFQQPAIWAIVPTLIPKDLLTRINALDYLFTGVITLIGPLIAAVLLSVFGLESIYKILFVDVISYLISFIPLVFITIPSVTSKSKNSFAADFKEGVNFIKKTKGLTVLMTIFPFANLFLSPFQVLLPLIIVNTSIFGGDEKTLAFALGFQQIAFILSSFIMSKFVLFNKNTTGVALGIYLWILGILVVVFGGYQQSSGLLYFGMFITGMTIPITNVSSQTIWQTVVPLDLQGRVNVVRRFFGEGSVPVAYILAGIFAELITPFLVVLIGALIELCILTYILKFTSFQDVDQMITKSKESAFHQDQTSPS